MNSKQKEFIKELENLLRKYDASIEFDLDEGSDFYGISGEKMVISMKNNEDIIFKGNWDITSDDLKYYKEN